jgi:hypothetical protein
MICDKVLLLVLLLLPLRIVRESGCTWFRGG